MKLWSWWTDSNPRPADYKSAALPAELHQRITGNVSIITQVARLVKCFFAFRKSFFHLTKNKVLIDKNALFAVAERCKPCIGLKEFCEVIMVGDADTRPHLTDGVLIVRRVSK